MYYSGFFACGAGQLVDSAIVILLFVVVICAFVYCCPDATLLLICDVVVGEIETVFRNECADLVVVFIFFNNDY